MLRWFVVCALLAHTLAAPRIERHSWPNWMKMPKADWWKPSRDDLPDVTIPDIDLPELPTIPAIIPEIPDINVRMPGGVEDVLQSWRNPFGNHGNDGGQQQQRQSGRGQGQGSIDGSQQQSRSDGRRPTPNRNGHQGSSIDQASRGRSPAGQQQPRQQQQAIGQQQRGPWSYNPRQRPPPISPESKQRKQRPPQREQHWRGGLPETHQSNPRRPSHAVPSLPVTKQRKQRPHLQREGPPQRSASLLRGQTRPRKEPSMTRQVETFRTGMPRWLQEELSDTFRSMEREIHEGRLQMSSWSDDITTATQDWWNKWTGSRDTTESR